MCDQDHFEEDLKKYTRRDLGTLAAIGVGAAIMLPRAADAADVSESDDGDPSFFHRRNPSTEREARRGCPGQKLKIPSPPAHLASLHGSPARVCFGSVG